MAPAKKTTTKPEAVVKTIVQKAEEKRRGKSDGCEAQLNLSGKPRIPQRSRRQRRRP